MSEEADDVQIRGSLARRVPPPEIPDGVSLKLRRKTVPGKGTEYLVVTDDGALVGTLFRSVYTETHSAIRYVNGRASSASVARREIVRWRARDAHGAWLCTVTPDGALRRVELDRQKDWLRHSSWRERVHTHTEDLLGYVLMRRWIRTEPAWTTGTVRYEKGKPVLRVQHFADPNEPGGESLCVDIHANAIVAAIRDTLEPALCDASVDDVFEALWPSRQTTPGDVLDGCVQRLCYGKTRWT